MVKSKSIGIVCGSSAFGGLELSTLQLARHLVANGWKLRFLLHEQSPMFAAAQKDFSDLSSIQQFGSSSKVKAKTLKIWLSDSPVSVLFTPYNKDIRGLSGYKRFRNKKVKLVYQQQMKVGVNKRDLIHRFRYQMLDLWISPLPYLKQETITRTHVPERKIKIIPLAVDAGKILNTSMTQDIGRAQLGLPPEVKLLGVLGRIDPKKGQDFAVRVLSQLGEHGEYHLLIMGNMTMNEGDEYHDHLRKLVVELKLEDRVHFRPYHEDVNLFYQAIDIFLMPSHGETFGLVTVEAMLSQKPIVGVNRDGTAALLESGRLGWLHDLEDVDTCCRHILELRDLKYGAPKLQEAKSVAMARYTYERTMPQLEEALTKLINDKY